MKHKLLLLALLVQAVLFGHAQIQVSTGLNAALTGAEPIGNIDPHWIIASSPNPAGTPARVSNAFPGYWQPTPIGGTNAGWINVPGHAYGSNLPGIYVFERNITIPANTVSLTCNFRVAFDDQLVAVELVSPSSSTTPLPVVPTTAYYLSQPITTAIASPQAGVWKIRATVDFIDAIGGFLLSGNVDIKVNAPCRNSFVVGLDNMGGTAPGMFADPAGGLFATGLTQDSTVLVKADANGNLQWIQKFKLGTGFYQIRDLQVDATGDLIGIAHQKGSTYQSVIFRCDATATTFAWIDDVSDVSYSQLHLLNANEFIVTGSNSNGNTQLELRDKGNGAITGYSLEGEGGDYYSTLVGNTLYGACRRYYNGNDFRTCVFAHDANAGNFQWQENIISQGNGPSQTRMYPVAPIEDNGELVTLASGDLAGFNTYNFGPVEMAAAKTDLNGNSIWTIEYTIAGYNRPVVTAIKNTANGYYMVVNLYLPSLGNFGYTVVIRTDKNGKVVWAKRLGISGRNMANTVFERNGSLYLSMSSDSYQPNQLLLIKLDPQGNSNASCKLISPIQVIASGLLNVQDNRPYPVSTMQFLETNSITAPIAAIPNPQVYCETICKDWVSVENGGMDVDDVIMRKAVPAAGTSQVLQLYPNPADDLATLQLSAPVAPHTMLQLSDLSGRVLRKMAWPAGTRQLNMRLAGLPAGIYSVTVIFSNKQTATIKLVKK